MVTSLVNIVIASVIAQAIVQAFKKMYDFKKGYSYKNFNMKVVLSIIVSLIICIAGNIDLFNVIGITVSVPYLGATLTGFIISLGSNSTHDLLKQLTAIRENPSIEPNKPEDSSQQT